LKSQKEPLNKKRSLEELELELELDSDDEHEIESEEEFLHNGTSQSDLKVIEPPKKKQKCNTVKKSQTPLTKTNTTNSTNYGYLSKEENEYEVRRCSERSDNFSKDDERVVEKLEFKQCESVEQQNVQSFPLPHSLHSKVEMKLRSLKRDEERHQRFVQKLADVQRDEVYLLCTLIDSFILILILCCSQKKRRVEIYHNVVLIKKMKIKEWKRMRVVMISTNLIPHTVCNTLHFFSNTALNFLMFNIQH
jgi:hypothetical protein